MTHAEELRINWLINQSNIKTLLRAYEEFKDYFGNRILKESKVAEDEAGRERTKIIKEIKILKDALGEEE